MFRLNPEAWGGGEHLTIRLLRLLSLPGVWGGACVSGVTGGIGGAACVWGMDGPGGIIYWGRLLLRPCQASAVELVAGIVNGVGRLFFFSFEVPKHPCFVIFEYFFFFYFSSFLWVARG